MATTDDNQAVTVVMPCYNGMPYLPEALDSAVAQTHRPAAIIVVDDGSKDDSAACVRSYAEKYPDHHVQLIQQANAGEPAARNTGINAATTAWVAGLDTDDWWEPNKLAAQVEAASEAGPDCVMVHTGVIRHFPDGRAEEGSMTGPSSRVGWCTESLLEPTHIAHPSIMVRRNALERIGGYDPSFKQACDIDLYFRLSAVGAFAFVPKPLLHYRYHANQMSARQVDQIGYHHRAVHKFFEAHPDIEERIGREKIDAKLAEHVALKLRGLYWKRRLDEFRELLDYAAEKGIDNADIQAWRQRARWPNWVIRMKDRVTARDAS